MRQLVGMINQLARFALNCAHVIRPLTELLSSKASLAMGSYTGRSIHSNQENIDRTYGTAQFKLDTRVQQTHVHLTDFVETRKLLARWLYGTRAYAG